MTIKRYDILDDGVYVSMEPRETGRFVKYDDHLAALRREREPVYLALEPMAVAHHFDGYGWQYIDNGSGSDWLSVGKKYDDAVVLVDQADALALVAAAYRDAAGLPAFDCTGDPCGTFDGKVFVKLDAILARTPADAQAALAAIERAAYERGVRDALTEAIKEAKGSVTIGGQRFLTTKLDDLEPALLALITQEGR